MSWWRTLVWALGALLVAIGVVATGLLVYVATRFDANEDVPTAAVLLALAVLAPALGGRLMGVRRRLALFLRRFGRAEATHAITHALAASTGRVWRVVSLDDAGLTPVAIEPVGLRRRSRYLARAVTVTLAAGTGLGFWRLSTIKPSDNSRSSDKISDLFDRVGRWLLSDNPTFETLLLRGGVGLAAVGVTIWVAGKIAGRLVDPVLGLPQNANEAEGAKRLSIATAEDVRPVTRQLIRRSRRFLSPQLVAVRVEGSLWQDVVRRLARQSAAVIIDVSEASENVLWEIEHLRAGSSHPWVFVGDTAKVTAIRGTPADPLQHRLADALAGHDVLLYGDSTADLDRFSDQLRRTMT